MYSLDIVRNKIQTLFWQHEIIKTLTDIKLRNTDRELNNRNICNNILKTEILQYKRELVILLNMFLSLKLKYTIKGAIAQIEKKQVKLTCESIPSENPNKNQNKTSLVKPVFFSIT